MTIQITQKNLVGAPIGAGDAGIVIRPDGRPEIFNTYSPEELANPTPEQSETMERLIAVLTAWSLPPVMDVLLQVAADPAIMNPQIELGRVN